MSINVNADTYDIRKVNNAKTFSKAAYEINETNLVDVEVATNLFHNVVIDVDADGSELALDKIQTVEGTIKVRRLF